MAEAVVLLRMSESMQSFMVAALDLLTEVEIADQTLIPDEVRQATERLRAIVDEWSGEL